MIMNIRFGYEYIEITATEKNPIKHLVVRVATTPPEALESLRDYDKTYFEHMGEHPIEFIEE